MTNLKGQFLSERCEGDSKFKTVIGFQEVNEVWYKLEINTISPPIC